MSPESSFPTPAEHPSPSVTLINGRPAVTSIDVANFFGKQHAHVMRSIKEIIDNSPESFSASNFGLAEYLDEQGKPRPMYHLFRDGFMLLVMGYTGKEAMQMKLAYIEAFNSMEVQLREQAQQALPPAAPEAEAIASPSPVLTLIEGRPATTSVDVAIFFDKEHADVLCDLANVARKCPYEFTKQNFSLSWFIAKTGSKNPMYHIFRDGFMKLVTKYTGEKAEQSKLAYMEAFNRMEAELQEGATPALSSVPNLELDSGSTAPLPVQFHDITLCILSHNNKPYVPIKVIVEGLGIDWKTQAAKLGKDKIRWACETLLLTHPGESKEYKTLCMPLHMLQEYLRGINTQRVKRGLKGRIKLYQTKCAHTLLAAWRAHKNGTEFLPSGKVSTTPLRALLKAWGEVSDFTPSAMKAQVQATFAVPNIADLTADQMSQALAWVQNKIDAATARERKQLPPSTTPALPPAQHEAEPAFLPPALQDDGESKLVDDLIREYDNGQIQQHKDLHLRIMKLIHWSFVGMEWFDLASNIIFCMLSAPRYERSGRAGDLALPVQFAQELDKLLSHSRWQELDASRRPAA